MAAEVRRKQFKEETSTFSYKNNKRSHSPALSIPSIPASSHSENTRTISLCQADICITLPTVVPLSQAYAQGSVSWLFACADCSDAGCRGAPILKGPTKVLLTG